MLSHNTQPIWTRSERTRGLTLSTCSPCHLCNLRFNNQVFQTILENPSVKARTVIALDRVQKCGIIEAFQQMLTTYPRSFVLVCGSWSLLARNQSRARQKATTQPNFSDSNLTITYPLAPAKRKQRDECIVRPCLVVISFYRVIDPTCNIRTDADSFVSAQDVRSPQ